MFAKLEKLELLVDLIFFMKEVESDEDLNLSEFLLFVDVVVLLDRLSAPPVMTLTALDRLLILLVLL